MLAARQIAPAYCPPKLGLWCSSWWLCFGVMLGIAAMAHGFLAFCRFLQHTPRLTLQSWHHAAISVLARAAGGPRELRALCDAGRQAGTSSDEFLLDALCSGDRGNHPNMTPRKVPCAATRALASCRCGLGSVEQPRRASRGQTPRMHCASTSHASSLTW